MKVPESAQPTARCLVLVVLLAVSLVPGCASRNASGSAGPAPDDPAISDQVRQALLIDPLLRRAEISVDTVGGVVRLRGFVASPAAVSRATDVAAGIPGVVAVRNDLSVRS